MARRSQKSDPAEIRKQLLEILDSLDVDLDEDDLRSAAQALVPAHYMMRDLGSSLVREESATSARARILHYLRSYPHTPLAGEELMVIAGIGEWARRLRELRVQDGWRIISGVTLSEMAEEEQGILDELGVDSLAPDEYLLLSSEPDTGAAGRWKLANQMRKTEGGVRARILEFMRANVGAHVTSEELRYVAADKTEWARRVRELRTEHGWPIVTKQTGRPDLPVGVYVLEEDRQAPEHDRKIPDSVRSEVLMRDNYSCVECGWHHGLWNRSDPRHLEAHHVVYHKDRGANDASNLVTLCTVCHDATHASS